MKKYNPDEGDPALFYAVSAGICFLIIIISAIFWNSLDEFSIKLGPILLAFGIVFYLAFGSNKIEIDEQAIVTFFGKPVLILKSGHGLIIAFPGVFKLTKFPTENFLLKFPADIENTYKDDDKKELPKGMARPVRIPTASEETAVYKDEEDKKHYLRDPMNKFRLIPIVNWAAYTQLFNLILLVRNVGRLKRGETYPEKIWDFIRDSSENALMKAFSKKTPAQIIGEAEEIDKEVVERIKDLVAGWGLKVPTVQLLAPDFTHEYSAALRDAAKAYIEKIIIRTVAEAERDAVIIKAEGEKMRLMLEGEGLAHAKQVLIEAEAIGYKKLAEALNMSEPDLVLKLAVAKEALMGSTNRTLLLGTGAFNELFGIIPMVSAALGALKNQGGNPA